MSVLIKGMEMPKEGTFNMVYIYSDGRVSMPCWGKGMQVVQGIEAVSVPPHGDLIDLSTVNLDDGPYEYQDWVEWALEQYQDAPVFMSADPPRRNTDES